MTDNSKNRRRGGWMVGSGISSLIIGKIIDNNFSVSTLEKAFMSEDELTAATFMEILPTILYIWAAIDIIIGIILLIASAASSDNDNEYRPPSMPPTAVRSEANMWICPNCGRHNAEYIGSCACGTRKSSAPTPQTSYTPPTTPYYAPPATVSPQPGFWICPKCNRQNADYTGSCACGERKPSASPAPAPAAETPATTQESKPKTFCPYCGEKINANQIFCGKCGSNLK